MEESAHGQDPAVITERDASHILWARVDEGFYVGSLPGRFLGCIDRQPDGSFLALDIHTRPIGSFPDLKRAMTAVHQATIEEASA